MELFVVLILVTINLLILTQVNVSLVYCFVQQTGFRAREIGKPSRSCAPVVSDDGGKIFDEESYEKDRLAKDAKAMDAMKAVADVELNKKGNGKQQQQLRSPWKWALRKRIWDYMEENDIARFPRPVHHRIPNFVGADLAAKRLIQLPEFQSANIIKVNPDTPQRPVRHFVLEQGKTLLTPQPRLRTGFFSTIQMKELPSLVEIEQCTNSKGVVKYGTPITLNEEYKVDLVVVGSTAVCPRTGARVGKGEGFAELEWGILSAQGNLNAETCLVVTTVHDCQVIENEQDMPEGWALTKHDVPVDIIVTPTRTIQVSNRLPKPSGIFWNLLSPQKLAAIRVLRQLKQETEKKLGEVLPSGPEELLPPLAARNSKKKNSGNNKSGKKQRQPQRPATK
jgi:5-formyltetrahydrofolate cyclo-ligase